FRVACQQHRTVESKNLINIGSLAAFDDGELKPVYIIKLDGITAKQPGHLRLNAVVFQMLFPGAQAAFWYSEGDPSDLAAPFAAIIVIRPWEECDDRARCCVMIGKVQVIDARIIKVD